MLDEIKDNTLMDLVEKHFNAVTFGNELKPDALFNYQLEKSVKTKTVQFDGQDLEVPVVNDAGDSLDFSRADAMVDKILEWNAAQEVMCSYGIHRLRNGSSMRTMISVSHM